MSLQTNARLAAIAAIAGVAIAQEAQPLERRSPELGNVDWLRDWDTAAAQSKSSGKPIAVLFQEVPG